MKKNYRKPTSKRIELDVEDMMQTILPGSDNDEHKQDADAKRQSFIFDDGNIIDDRSTSYSEADSYSHADL